MSNSLPSWREASWKDRAVIAMLNIIGWGLIFPFMLIGMIFLIGATFEGFVQYQTDLENCRKHAETPYEYHQCK